MNTYKYFIIIFCLLLVNTLYSQKSISLSESEQISNINKSNEKYQKRIDIETVKSKDFYVLAIANLQSAKLMISRIVEGSATEGTDKDMANIVTKKASMYMRRSDSVSKIADQYQDSIRLNLKLLNEITNNQITTNKRDSIIRINNLNVTNEEFSDKTDLSDVYKMYYNKTTIYIIQIACDKDRSNYQILKNIAGLKIVKCKDGYFRYFLGEYENMNKAKIGLTGFISDGYRESFIRTLKPLTKN